MEATMDVDENLNNKKRIKWQDNSGGSNGNPDISSSSFLDEPSNKSLQIQLSGFFSFLFSPMGIFLMFVLINFPWMRSLVLTISSSIASSSASSSSSTLSSSAVGSSGGAVFVDNGTFVNATTSSIYGDEFLVNCKNPIKRMFDRYCRQEIKRVRMENRDKRWKQQQEKREQRRKQKQQQRRRRQQEEDTFANSTLAIINANTAETAAKAGSSIAAKTGAGATAGTATKIVTDGDLHDSNTFVVGGNIMSNIHDLECNNLLSRECRQKKRLLAQIKSALNK